MILSGSPVTGTRRQTDCRGSHTYSACSLSEDPPAAPRTSRGTHHAPPEGPQPDQRPELHTCVALQAVAVQGFVRLAYIARCAQLEEHASSSCWRGVGAVPFGTVSMLRVFSSGVQHRVVRWSVAVRLRPFRLRSRSNRILDEFGSGC